MKTGKNRADRQPTLRLLVLVPHRDARLPLRTWSASLFAAGLHGAWSFPWAAPLAVLGRHLSAEELKRLARALREHIAQNGGKFLCGRPDFSNISRKGGKAQSFLRTSEQGLSVFGPSLQIDLPDNFFAGIDDAALSRISPLVIGCGLIGNEGISNEELVMRSSNYSFLTSHCSFFSAAALANMSFRALRDGHNDYSYEWKIGALYWLPKNASYTKSTTTNP